VSGLTTCFCATVFWCWKVRLALAAPLPSTYVSAGRERRRVELSEGTGRCVSQYGRLSASEPGRRRVDPEGPDGPPVSEYLLELSSAFASLYVYNHRCWRLLRCRFTWIMPAVPLRVQLLDEENALLRLFVGHLHQYVSAFFSCIKQSHPKQREISLLSAWYRSEGSMTFKLKL
jgi:hypothetical protein